ncbi:hypothetical protein [Agromyces humi]|uniref:hypothetical protein n=1 Tax=Agromyces humi TaxID=1766800 RepID=UPI001359AFE8|nr:hypothetical protein [Agromyces humi]
MVGAGALVVGILVGVAIGVPVGSSATESRLKQEAASAAAAAEKAAEEAKSTFFADAVKKCNLVAYADVEDDGTTLIIDGEGEDALSGDIDFTGLDCVIDAVGTPSRVRELMYETRSLDGRQSGNWEAEDAEIEASWSYHPDDGLDIIFELVN